jgi:hypothetical protein
VGAVTDVVRRKVPASYAALAGSSNAYFGGVTELQALADYVKFRIFATNVASASEAVVYDLKQVQLLGVLTTLQFIPAAVDYWATQLSSESLTDPSENKVYRDPRPELWNIFEQLVAEADMLGNDLGVGVLGVKGVIPRISYGDNGRNILSTPDPIDFGYEYDVYGPSDLIPWRTP